MEGENTPQKHSGIMPKTLLVAILASLFIPGLGQLYVGQPRKGSVFFLILLLIPLLFGLIGLNSNYYALVSLAFVEISLHIFYIIDVIIQFKKSKSYKIKKNIKRDYYIYYILVIGVFSFFSFYNTSSLIGHQTFKALTTSLSPTLQPGDYVGVDTEIEVSKETVYNQLLVFNFPEGDTVCVSMPYVSYYSLIRQYGRNAILQEKIAGDIRISSVDEKETYIKRCVALPGDEIKIVDSQLFINGKGQDLFKRVQYNYFIATDGQAVNKKFLQKYGISFEDAESAQRFVQIQDDINFIKSDKELSQHNMANLYIFPLTPKRAEQIKKNPFIKAVVRYVKPTGQYNDGVHPHMPEYYRWNEDNFGPLVIPKRGMVMQLTEANIHLYKRAIQIYENNELKIDGDKIYINGELADSYTFKMNYYWLMGDNRHNSADSRFWGFVPEDHVVGKALMVWFSSDKDKSFPANIRWDRILTMIH